MRYNFIITAIVEFQKNGSNWMVEREVTFFSAYPRLLKGIYRVPFTN